MQRDVAYLRVVRGPNKGRVFVLENLSVFEIGRVDSSHIWVPDDSICSSHARIYRRGEMWTFYDLNSEGGSWVNDVSATKRELDGGEVIRIGSVVLHFGFSPPTPNKTGNTRDELRISFEPATNTTTLSIVRPATTAACTPTTHADTASETGGTTTTDTNSWHQRRHADRLNGR